MNEDGLLWMSGSPIRQPRFYLIDWSKAKTVEEMALVLDALQIGIGENHSAFEIVKPYLKDTPNP